MDDYLYAVAEEHNIYITNNHTKSTKSFVVEVGNNYFVNIDNTQTIDAIDERVCLAHELGHCISGTTYTVDHTPLYRGSAEYRADFRAAQLLVPIDELIESINKGIDQNYDLAEYFSVTGEFIERVLYIYNNKGLLQGVTISI